VKDIVGIAERYVQNDPKNIRLLEILQSAYLLTKQFAKLEPIVDYTLKLQESNIKSLQNKAMFYRMKGDLVNARNMLVLAWVWSPEYLPVLQELIEVNRLLGRDNSEFLKVMEKIEQRKGKTGDELFYYGSNINTKTQ